MWYVYFLELNNGDIYVGSTNDLKRRKKSHDNGEVASTKPFLPTKLKTYVLLKQNLLLESWKNTLNQALVKLLRRRDFFSKVRDENCSSTTSATAREAASGYSNRAANLFPKNIKNSSLSAC